MLSVVGIASKRNEFFTQRAYEYSYSSFFSFPYSYGYHLPRHAITLCQLELHELFQIVNKLVYSRKSPDPTQTRKCKTAIYNGANAAERLFRRCIQMSE